MSLAPLLSVENLTMRFGGLVAVNNLSFEAQSHHITALIGPNGAGKTTVFNCLTGFYKAQSGHLIVHDNHNHALEKLKDHQITRHAKFARTFQNIRLFAGMTVLENLLVAQHNTLMQASFFSLKGIFGSKSYKQAEQAAIDKACFWLDQIGLRNEANHLAGSLSYGAQRRLEIARAMCTSPRLLCLDEPAAGLNPKESLELNQLLLMIKREHCAILLIEHDMSVVMAISDHIVVMEYGQKIADGPPALIRHDPKVIAAYLGVEEA